MALSSVAELSGRNKSAWDQLYASTPELIWGRDPIGFLPGRLPRRESLPAGGVLDAAAGEGRNLPPLLGLGRPVTACDASAAALEKIPRPLRERVSTLVCDLEQVPLPDAGLALVLLSDVMETLPDPASAVAELHRLLAPGGFLLANVPGNDDGVAGVDMQPADGGGWLYRGRFFYRFYDRTEAEALFSAAGLEIAACESCSWEEPPHPRFRSVLHLHRSLVVLARRPS